MKKLLSILSAAMLVFSLAACSTSTTSSTANSTTSSTASSTANNNEAETDSANQTDSDKQTVKITTLNADKEAVEIEVPYDPQRLAVMDLAVLDMMDNLGLGDRLVGVSKGSSIDYLDKYVNDDALVNLGTIKEMSIEKVLECDPDIIFIGGRLSKSYDELSKIAPVVFLSSDLEIGNLQSTKNNANTIASIFGVEDKVETLFTDFDSRIEAIQEISKDKTAFVGMLNAGGFNVLGNDGACSLIGVEAGFNNIGLGTEKGEEPSTITSAHGNETSFEYIVRLNPDYIFVMNRDDAIGTEGAAPAQEVIENDLIKMTDAYTNGNIVYLENSNVWYTASGGITGMDYMLKDLENALLK